MSGEHASESETPEATPQDVQELIGLLDLEVLDRDLFRARNPRQALRWRLFGGQVAAQAVRAASLTVDEDRGLHSLHGYFLRPGDPDRPTLLHVDRDRDGRSFTARHVVARQGGDAIFTMLASFHTHEQGAEHQEVPMPDVPAPEDLEPGRLWSTGAMFDVRSVWNETNRRTFPGISNMFWARTRAPIPDDPLMHECVLTYLSDVGSGFLKHPPDDPPLGGPSLDHAVWFHRPLRMDEWVLVDLEPVVASGGRAYYTGAVYDRDGHLLATIAQEHLRRLNPPDPRRAMEAARRAADPAPAPAPPPAPSG